MRVALAGVGLMVACVPPSTTESEDRNGVVTTTGKVSETGRTADSGVPREGGTVVAHVPGGGEIAVSSASGEFVYAMSPDKAPVTVTGVPEGGYVTFLKGDDFTSVADVQDGDELWFTQRRLRSRNATIDVTLPKGAQRVVVWGGCGTPLSTVYASGMVDAYICGDDPVVSALAYPPDEGAAWFAYDAKIESKDGALAATIDAWDSTSGTVEVTHVRPASADSRSVYIHPVRQGAAFGSSGWAVPIPEGERLSTMVGSGLFDAVVVRAVHVFEGQDPWYDADVLRAVAVPEKGGSTVLTMSDDDIPSPLTSLSFGRSAFRVETSLDGDCHGEPYDMVAVERTHRIDADTVVSWTLYGPWSESVRFPSVSPTTDHASVVGPDVDVVDVTLHAIGWDTASWEDGRRNPDLMSLVSGWEEYPIAQGGGCWLRARGALENPAWAY